MSSVEDAGWNVVQFRLPSAYFAVTVVQGAATPDIHKLPIWQPSPEAWPQIYHRVKQLESLQVGGQSLSAEYLDFFLAARAELWQVLFGEET